jgi:heptose I phosphotransferase
MNFYLDPSLKQFFSADAPLFEQCMALTGECFRKQKGRTTERIQLGGQFYFIKKHEGVGFKEIIKNMLQLRLPIVGAKNEWLAISALETLGVSVPKVMAYGERGIHPAYRQSFILMKELQPSISLEELTQSWSNKAPAAVYKRQLIFKVARIARMLHQAGINHRDFYLCHFLLNANTGDLSLIDLHRAAIRSKIPKRWLLKDLAGLYFSSKGIGLTRRDAYRFMMHYQQKNLREIIEKDDCFWQQVRQGGDKLYREHCE